MDLEGPDLETLTRRLTDTPPDFMDEPLIAGRGKVAVAAVVNDVLHLHGTRATQSALVAFHGNSTKGDRNRLALVLIVAWLLVDDWFLAMRFANEVLLQVLIDIPGELAPTAPASRFIDDAERREELARVVLGRLGYRPLGETCVQATDRLVAVSAAERRRLLDASRAAEQRAREIREALARKVAEESADKWTRE